MVDKIRNRVQENESFKVKDAGRLTFIVLLLGVPLIVIGALIWLGITVDNEPDPRISSMTTITQGGVITTTTTYFSPTLSLGATDPALGKIQGFFVGPILALIGGLIETSLLLIFASFYVFKDKANSPYKNNTLGLPDGAVRVFLIIIVVLVILIFSLMPEAWGNNRAVTTLFGMFATVVGFYFGNKALGGSSSTAPQPQPQPQPQPEPEPEPQPQPQPGPEPQPQP